MSISRYGIRRLTSASAAVTRQQGVGAAAATRSFVAVAQAAGRIPAHQTFAALTVGGSSSSSSSAFASSPHFQQRRGVVVNPNDADAWEKFILGLPANLKEDIRFRKKLFFEADKGGDPQIKNKHTSIHAFALHFVFDDFRSGRDGKERGGRV